MKGNAMWNAMWNANEDDIAYLRAINDRLKTLQDMLLKEAINLDKTLRARVEDAEDRLHDYEIELKLFFYLKETHPDFKEDDDNIITIIHEYFKGIASDSKNFPWRWSDNHNEFKGWANHPLRDEHHCWWLHCLYDHNYLEISDILSIGDIWSDINVSYQYLNPYLDYHKQDLGMSI